MTEMITSFTGAPTASDWDSISWDKAKYGVKRLQMRIAKAIREKQYGKVRALQRLLTHSFYGKCIAVKRVIQNKGNKCPGVDGIIWRTKRQKMQAILSIKRRGYKALPLRRIYIPKKTGRRPLSIPTMKDRGMQALHLLSLEPIAETLADKNSYGFRSKRSTADAIEQCYNCLCRRNSAQWIFEGDIKTFFSKVSHNWLEENIIMDRNILREFLKAGYIEKHIIEETEEGVAQGGIISPAISLIALSGLEERLSQQFKRRRGKVNIISYADDFVIVGETKEVLEKEVIPLVENFLAERGLELSREKSRITHIDQGFDFLGFNVRKYKGKFLTKPTKACVKSFLADIRNTIRANSGTNAKTVIRVLNPKILGWANYYSHASSSKIFSYIDHRIFKTLYKWAQKRHRDKGARWICQKYFMHPKVKKWNFYAKTTDNKRNMVYLNLVQAGDTKIKRHTKILAKAHTFDPQYTEYFQMRDKRRKIFNSLYTYNRVH